MTKRSAPLDQDSPVNTVGTRLALYSVLAGVIATGAAIAIKRQNMHDAADLAERAESLSGERGRGGLGTS